MCENEIILPKGWEVSEIIANKIIIREIGNQHQSEFDKWIECLDRLNNCGDGTYKLSYISDLSIIKPRHIEGPITDMFLNTIPTEYARPILALMQLLVCYKVYVGDWKPDWNNTKQPKFSINVLCNSLFKEDYLGSNHLLSFPRASMRDEFLENFKGLIKEAIPFI
jgi:hypothetical protein